MQERRIQGSGLVLTDAFAGQHKGEQLHRNADNDNHETQSDQGIAVQRSEVHTNISCGLALTEESAAQDPACLAHPSPLRPTLGRSPDKIEHTDPITINLTWLLAGGNTP